MTTPPPLPEPSFKMNILPVTGQGDRIRLAKFAAIQVDALLPNPLNTIFFHRWASYQIQTRFFRLELKRKLEEKNCICYKAVNNNSETTLGYILCYTDCLISNLSSCGLLLRISSGSFSPNTSISRVSTCSV